MSEPATTPPRMYIAVLADVPDYIVPTLVAHSVLGAHLWFTAGAGSSGREGYEDWLANSFRKCVVRVNQREFDRIAALPLTYLGHENRTLGGVKSCAVPLPTADIPNVLKFARLWAPIPVD